MEKAYVIIIFSILILSTGCQEEILAYEDPSEEMDTLNPIGQNFQRVPWDYTNIDNGIQFVNPTGAVHEEGGSHWTFESPIHDGQEIGFSIIKSPECEDVPCKVVLFLHGTNGTENSGGTNLMTHYKHYHEDHPVVILNANGIHGGDSTSLTSAVWRPRNRKDTIGKVEPIVALYELIGGIVEDDTQFDFMSKDMNDWSAIGFSAGSSACLAMYLHEVFNDDKYLPKRIFPFGGWTYLDYTNQYVSATVDDFPRCNETDVDLIIANQMRDNVNCTGNINYDSTLPFIDNITERTTPFMFYGLNEEITPLCREKDDGSLTNRTHNVDFYLRHLINDTERIYNCMNYEQMGGKEILGDLLFEGY